MTSGQERRKFPRVPAIIEIFYETDPPVIRSRLADLSEGGLFVDTVNPLPPGTAVKFRFTLPGKAAEPPVSGRAKVAWNQAMMGMGIEFLEFDGDGWDRLRACLKEDF